MGDITLNNQPHMKPQAEANKCPSCGASVLSEVCQFCGTYVGQVSTLDLAAEYPTRECKNAKLSFWGAGVPFVVMMVCICVGVYKILPLILVKDIGLDREAQSMVNMFGLISAAPLVLVAAISAIIFFYNFISFIKVTIKGTSLNGTIYGYMDDTVAYNGVNGQKVKILVNTSQGKRFIIMPLKVTNKPYPVNSNVSVKVLENKVLIKTGKYTW